jgi:NAD(P)-dependent dehydrogenase (short-subunit alcohol dehydrogenase family)
MKTPNFSLKGKNAIVTGANGILGTYFCHALAAQGAQVAVLDLDQEKCFKLAQELEANYQAKALGMKCNVADPDEVQKVVVEIDEKWKGIHILHNNAASKGKSLDDFFLPFEDYKLETWKDIMSVNVDGMFLMAQAVGKKMIERNIKGSIIQTASIYGVVAPDQRIYKGSKYMDRPISSPAIYSASKAAVIGLSQYLAAYWGHKGIRVNTLTPGGVESGQNKTFTEKYSARVPMGRMALAEELSGALVYLASDASSYVNGQNIIVDGGLTVW